MIPRLFTDEPTCCGCCRGHAGSWGYAPKAGERILWLCADEYCLAGGRLVYHLKEKMMDAYEEKAREAAGNRGGEYLESIGNFDVGSLTPEQWSKFLDLTIQGFQDSLRHQILEGEAPF